MTETLCTSGSVKLAAGANVSSSITAANYTEFINQAEGDLVVDTRVNWVSNYSGLSADFKKALEGACAAKAAIKAIRYDMSGYTTVGEAVTMINTCLEEYDRAVARLKEQAVIKAVGASYIDAA